MIELFPFQQRNVEKLKEQPNVLIADEMGLGKTIQAIALDTERRKQDDIYYQTLVIAPLTVLPNWRQHFEEQTGLDVRMIDPKKRDELFAVKDADVYLIHYEAIRLMVDKLQKFPWLHIIADECHRIKNRKAQQTKALKKVKSRYKTALSGTPVVNRPDEYWSVLNWLYPKDFTSYWAHYNRFVDFQIIYPAGYHKILGPKNTPMLHERIGSFYARNLKKDVLPELPDKFWTDITVQLEPKQQRAYDEMRKQMIAWVGQNEDQPLVAPVVIAQLVRLQQFAVAHATIENGLTRLSEPSSKLDALISILKDNPDEQFVIFSNFKQLVGLLEKRLLSPKSNDKTNYSFVKITGDVTQRDRETAVEQFQAGKVRLFLGTPKAGGVGITLHSASKVVFLDRDWSPAVNSQAEDRLHRIGQKNAVQVIDIIAKNTVDLGRRAKLNLKASWLREILGDTA